MEEQSLTDNNPTTLAGDIDSEAPPAEKHTENNLLALPPTTAALNPNMGMIVESENDSIEVHWNGGDADPLNPRSLSQGKKWMILLVVSMSALDV